MPQIPRYNRQVVSESGQNVQENINYNANQFGAELGQTVSSASNSLADMFAKERLEADKVRVKEAEAALKEKQLLVENDPTNGLLNTRGKQSFNAPELADKELDSFSKELEKGLTPRQKQMFSGVSREVKFGSKQRLFNHASKERINYEDGVVQSYVANAKEIAAFNASDDETVEKEIAGIQQTLYDHAVKRGLDEDTIKVSLRKETSAVRKQVLENLIDRASPESAEINFNKYKGEMTEADADAVQKALDEGLLSKKAQREADALLMSGSVESAIRGANKIEDVKLRDEVKKRVIGAEQEIAQAEKLDRDNNYMDAYNRVEANIAVYPKDTIGAARWSKLMPKERESLLELYNNKGISTTTDWGTYYDLQQKAGNPATRKEFLNTNLLELKPKLGNSEFKKLADLQNNLKAGKGEQALDGIETKTNIVNNSLRQAGIKFAGKGSNKVSIERANNFRRLVDEAVVDQQQRTGKKVTNEEVRKITETLMSQVVVGQGMFWGSRTKPAFEVDVNEGDKPQIRFQDIPQNEKKNIREALQKKGLAGSDDEVTAIYSKKLNRFLNDK